MSYGNGGLGIAPIAVATGITGVVKGIKSLFGGGPSEEQLPGGAEYEYRKATALEADSRARGGDTNAWHFLGALGRRKALPVAISLANMPKRPKKTSTGPAGESYGTAKAGWMASKWGDSFAPIQAFAATDYDELASQMYPTAASPVQPGGPAPVVSGGDPILASMGGGSSMTPLLLGGLVLAGLAYVATSRRRRG